MKPRFCACPPKQGFFFEKENEMKSNRLLIVSGVLILSLVFGAGYWVHTVLHSKKDVTAADVTGRSEDMETDTPLGALDDLAVMAALRSLRREIESLRLEMQDLRNAMPAGNVTKNPDTDTVETRAHPKESAAETYRRRMDEEVVDRDWAPKMENQIVAALQKEVFQGTRLKTAVCRASVCEITVEHDSEADQIRFSDTFPLEGVKSSGGTITSYGNEQEGWGSTGFLERFISPQPADTSTGPPLKVPSTFKN